MKVLVFPQNSFLLKLLLALSLCFNFATASNSKSGKLLLDWSNSSRIAINIFMIILIVFGALMLGLIIFGFVVYIRIYRQRKNPKTKLKETPAVSKIVAPSQKRRADEVTIEPKSNQDISSVNQLDQSSSFVALDSSKKKDKGSLEEVDGHGDFSFAIGVDEPDNGDDGVKGSSYILDISCADKEVETPRKNQDGDVSDRENVNISYVEEHRGDVKTFTRSKAVAVSYTDAITEKEMRKIIEMN